MEPIFRDKKNAMIFLLTLISALLIISNVNLWISLNGVREEIRYVWNVVYKQRELEKKLREENRILRYKAKLSQDDSVYFRQKLQIKKELEADKKKQKAPLKKKKRFLFF